MPNILFNSLINERMRNTLGPCSKEDPMCTHLQPEKERWNKFTNRRKTGKTDLYPKTNNKINFAEHNLYYYQNKLFTLPSFFGKLCFNSIMYQNSLFKKMKGRDR